MQHGYGSKPLALSEPQNSWDLWMCIHHISPTSFDPPISRSTNRAVAWKLPPARACGVCHLPWQSFFSPQILAIIELVLGEWSPLHINMCLYMLYVYIYNIYPPTPAFANAGAAPGTTGGVELGSRVASKGTRHQGNASASYTCPSHLHAPAELLHLHAPAICFSGGSRLPFARPQTPQTLPQASKATTLTATCPCHLFFREFKPAVWPAWNPPNASAGLQGNNSYSYMPLPSVFQGVQACRLPARKTPHMLPCSSHAVCQLRHCPFMVVQA